MKVPESNLIDARPSTLVTVLTFIVGAPILYLPLSMARQGLFIGHGTSGLLKQVSADLFAVIASIWLGLVGWFGATIFPSGLLISWLPTILAAIVSARVLRRLAAYRWYQCAIAPARLMAAAMLCGACSLIIFTGCAFLSAAVSLITGLDMNTNRVPLEFHRQPSFTLNTLYEWSLLVDRWTLVAALIGAILGGGLACLARRSRATPATTALPLDRDAVVQAPPSPLQRAAGWVVLGFGLILTWVLVVPFFVARTPTANNPDGIYPPRTNPFSVSSIPIDVIAPPGLPVALAEHYESIENQCGGGRITAQGAPGHVKLIPINLLWDGHEYRGAVVLDRFLPGRCGWQFEGVDSILPTAETGIVYRGLLDPTNPLYPKIHRADIWCSSAVAPGTKSEPRCDQLSEFIRKPGWLDPAVLATFTAAEQNGHAGMSADPYTSHLLLQYHDLDVESHERRTSVPMGTPAR
jgi:hypothetical protein